MRVATGAQVVPLRLQLDKSLEVFLLRLLRIFGLETELDFPLADKRLQMLRDPFAQPTNSGLGMLPGMRHRKGHVTHPCVPLEQLSALIYLDFVADQHLRVLLVPRRGLGLLGRKPRQNKDFENCLLEPFVPVACTFVEAVQRSLTATFTYLGE